MAIEQTTRSDSALQGHTPGPWSVECSHIYAPDGAMLAQVHNPGSKATDYPLIANRNLMAASPLMMDALIAAKQEMWIAARDQWTMADFKNWAVIQQIDAALNAARGVA